VELDSRVHWLEVPKLGRVRMRIVRRRGPTAADTPALLLAHGAGNDMDTPLLVDVQRALAEAGVLCATFNFFYREQRRKAPDPMPVLEETYRCAIASLRQSGAEGRPLVLGGKSLGGRVASHLVAAGEPAAGLVFLGYPLHPAGRPEQLRTAHWSRIRVPLLFVQGTRDSLCRLDLLEAEIARWQRETGGTARLEIIDGGDHSFVVPRSLGRSQADVHRDIAARIFRWFSTLPGLPPAHPA
jgi:predicted alpha/beta-hydrolase family hydrolase